MVTSFTKMVVVLSLLRNALGLQQVPPNVVLNGLALVLSIYVMYPVGTEMAARLQGIAEIGGNTQTSSRPPTRRRSRCANSCSSTAGRWSAPSF